MSIKLFYWYFFKFPSNKKVKQTLGWWLTRRPMVPSHHLVAKLILCSALFVIVYMFFMKIIDLNIHPISRGSRLSNAKEYIELPVFDAEKVRTFVL